MALTGVVLALAAMALATVVELSPAEGQGRVETAAGGTAGDMAPTQ